MVRKLCKECGLDSSGSRTDLLLRLSSEMKSRQTYDKVFQKIWAASGRLVYFVYVTITVKVLPLGGITFKGGR